MALSADYKMLIDGGLVGGDQTLDVVNPATGTPFACVPRAGAAELDRAVEAAQRAFPAWRVTPYAERRRAVLAAAQTIESHVDELAPLFTRENGRPHAGAEMEIRGAAAWLRGMAAFELPVEVTEDSGERRVEIHREPVGVVCGLVPWNFPVMLGMFKLGPPLLAGNTVVVKPSPYTPVCTLQIAELIRGHFPAGVVNVLTGGDELGPMMTAHPGFAKITFTGSTATGKRVMDSAARDLKRVTLELGGNDAAIVLADVDVDDVAQKLFLSAFGNTSQVCVATKRLYAHRDVYAQLRDKLHAMAKAVKIGDGMEPGTVLGPIQNERQFRRVRELLDDAKRQGLTILEGGEVPNRGYFVPLAIVDDPPETARVVQEEAFGPILPMMSFTDIDDAVARANATSYGLGGSVWSKDIAAAVKVAHRLDTGTVWINSGSKLSPLTPLSGRKQSGLGVESGLAGLLEYTQPKVIWIPKDGAA